MHYIGLLAFVTAVVLLHYGVVGRAYPVLTVDKVFVFTQWVLASGTLVLLDSNDQADRLYSLVVTIPLVLYVVTSILFFWIRNSKRQRPATQRLKIVPYRPTFPIWGLLLISATVTITYFVAVGYNTFILGIYGLATGTTEDYTTLRLESYSNARHLLPGYFNQFKNILLPSLATVISIYLFQTARKDRFLVFVPAALLSAVGLLGTGQRGAFILFCLTLLIFSSFWHKKGFVQRASIGSLFAAPLLLITTMILGRTTSGVRHGSTWTSDITLLGSELLVRFFHDNQFSGQMAFRFTSGMPIQNGAEWVSAVLGILPHHPGSPLGRQVFHWLYGTDRGTAPPSIWGSVFHNFGWSGVVVMAVTLGVVYQTASHRCIAKKNMNTVELLGMAGTFAVCGSWIAGGPEYLLNAGCQTFILLWWMGHRANNVKPSEPPLPRRSNDFPRQGPDLGTPPSRRGLAIP